MNGFPATGTVVKLLSDADFPHDEASELMKMALAEAGYPNDPEWNDMLGHYVTNPRVPDDVLQKARVLVLTQLGIPFKVVAVA